MKILNEDQLQAACIQAARNKFPQIARLIWAVPNSNSDPKEAARKIATGQLSGCWDVHMFWQHYLYIFEFKYGSNQLTRDTITKTGGKRYGQFEFGQAMAAQGAICHIIHATSQQDAERAVNEFLLIVGGIVT